MTGKTSWGGVGFVALLAACAGGTKKLDGKGRGTGDADVALAPQPLEVKPMTGPFAGLAEYCTAAAGEYQAQYPHQEDVECGALDCDCSGPGDCEGGGECDDCEDAMACHQNGGTTLPSGPQALSAPFRSALFVAVGASWRDCRILVETDGGWFALSVGSCGDRDNRTSFDQQLLELASRDRFPGGSSELVVRLRSEEMASNMDNDGVHRESVSERQIVCGIGASGRPSCVAPLELSKRWSVKLLDGDFDPEMAPRPDPDSGAWERSVAYSVDAMVVTGGDDEHVGRHPVTFP